MEFIGYTDKDIKIAKEILEQFAKSNDMFKDLDIRLDSYSEVNDAIELESSRFGGGFTILKTLETETRHSILGDREVPVFKYIPHVPRVIPGSYWEPDDVDMVEIGSFNCLGDALSAIYLEEVKSRLDDIVASTYYSQSFKEEEEQV